MRIVEGAVPVVQKHSIYNTTTISTDTKAAEGNEQITLLKATCLKQADKL